MGEQHKNWNEKQLVLAMAPIDQVFSAIGDQTGSVSVEAATLDEQERFASVIQACWTDTGPSKPYMKALIRAYVAKLEKRGAALESDALMELVFRASLQKETPPNPDEACYLSFQLPPEEDHRPLLRIRIFPYHNDVALRLWEAGATLAEYFLDNPSLVTRKRIFELGAGVGLTGIALAGCCNVESVYLTDFTEVCRTNMAHNIAINQEWLGSSKVLQGYLEWSSFGQSPHVSGGADNSPEALVPVCDDCLSAFENADILLAADVAYDVGVLKDLVAIVQCFLQKSPTTRQAYFGITRRNMKTFHTFLELLQEHGISYVWTWNGDDDPPLTIRFPCNFIQKRSDVRIASLKLDAVER